MNGDGILSGPIDLDGPRPPRGFRKVPGDPDVVVRHHESGFTGTVVSLTSTAVVLCDGNNGKRTFTAAAGAFVVDGERVQLVAATHRAATETATKERTASGSRAVAKAPARVARASRIFVEGIHDAELVEKVWGDDLRVEGVVVEQIEGADDLADRIREFDPSSTRRLGVLLDHLVEGTKEHRIAESVRHPDVLVRGHPYVDIWQAVRPAAVGIEAWPEIPRGQPWKEGICQALNWPDTTAAFWKKLLATVKTYRDLEPTFVGAVEELIDFVAPPSAD